MKKKTKMKTVQYDMFSIANNNIEDVKKILKSGIDVDLRDSDLRTPLMEAIIQNKKDFVKLFISLGADVNAVDSNKWTPLHFAVQEAIENNDLDVVKLLISSGADVNAQESNGNTPLSQAVFYKNKKVQEFLLSNNADENIENNYGISAKSLAESID